jgi:GNAT superfamily N-acetyltransferase
MKIRRLSLDSMPEIIDLLSLMNPSVQHETLQRRFEKILRESEQYHILGCECEGQLVGLTGLWFGTKMWCGDYAEIDHLMVHPDFRNRGIGTALIESAEKQARERDCNIMVIDSYSNNHASHRLYHRLGCEIWSFHFVKPLRSFEH